VAVLIDMQPVVLITGVPASGKSTVADLLARRFARAVHIQGDVFRRMVVAGRHEMTAPPSPEAIEQLTLRYGLGAATADTYHGAGFAVVLQDVVIGPSLAAYTAAIASRPLVVVVLAPSPAAVRRRELARHKAAYRDGYDPVDALDHALRTETPRLGLWLDTSEHTPEETVDEIIRRGRDEGLVA
jgi:predicted kinase